MCLLLLSTPKTWYGGADIAITLLRCVSVYGYVGVYVSTIK